MVIQSLYKEYFQKSRVFLYPELGIKRGVSVTPVETYVSWKDHYKPSDCKLCCLYHLRNDEEFRIFEKSKLLGNKLFHDFRQVEGNLGVYVFDFSHVAEDWDNFLKGKYSKLNKEYKNRIENFVAVDNRAYIESFLYPEKYYTLYADLMGVNEQVLREVGELCSKPEMEKEILDISILDLELRREMS